MTAQEALYKIRVMLGVEDTNKEVSLETETDTNVKLAETTLVDGTTIKTEGEFVEGAQVLVVTPEGDIPAPMGVHETTDGLLVEVDEQGVIVSITEPTEEEAKKEDKKSYEEGFNEDVIGQIVGGLKPMFDELQNQINTLKGEFSEFKDEPATDKIKNNLNELNRVQNGVVETRLKKIMELRENSYKK